MPLVPYNYDNPGTPVAVSKGVSNSGGTGGGLKPYDYGDSAATTPSPTGTPGLIPTFISNVVGGAKFVGANSGLDNTVKQIGSDLVAPAQPVTQGPVSLKNSTSAADDVGLSAVNTYANAFNDMVSRFQAAMSTATDQHATALQKGVAAGEAGVGALNFGFAPISAFLNGTSHIPVLGPLSTGLNNVFNAIGTGGSSAAEGAINLLPIPQEDKDTLTPLAKEIGALTAQIVAGKGSEATLEKVGDKTNQFLTKINDRMTQSNPIKASDGKTIAPNPLTKLPVYGDTTLRPLPVSDTPGTPDIPRNLPVYGDTTLRPLPVSGESTNQSVPISNDYRGTTPDIQMGAGAKDTSGLPVIKSTGRTTNGLGEYTVEPIKPSEAPTETPRATPVDTGPRSLPVTNHSPYETVFNANGDKFLRRIPVGDETPKTRSNPAPAGNDAVPTTDTASTPSSPTTENAPTVASGEQAPTKVANDISAKLVEQGVAELTPEQKSTYTTGSYKDSAEQAKILSEQDPEALKQMAITGKDIPAGVHPQILFNVVDKIAADTKDYKLQQELAKSPLGTERALHAQGLGGAGYNKVSDSPVDIIRKAVEDKAGGAKGKAQIEKQAVAAKETISKAAAKMVDYQKIIDAIKDC